MDILNPGVLSDPITVMKNITVKNGRGMTRLVDSELYCETMARVRPGRPISNTDNGRLVIIQPYNVTIWHDPDKVISPDMLVVFNGDNYVISAITGLDSRMIYFHFTITKA